MILKHFFIAVLCILCCLTMGGAVSSPEMSDTQPSDFSYELIQRSRLENLLNLNNIYGSEFDSNANIIDAATINLRNHADNDGFISNAVVAAFVKDLYGIDVVFTADADSTLPQRDGYVFLVPKGFTSYNHKINSVYEDGEFIKVISTVKISSHDGDISYATAETIFKRSDSRFGYIIINAEILADNNIVCI